VTARRDGGQRRGPGRPADGGDRKAAILTAAREQFGAKGYNGASLREVARQAAVDPALVHHYFGTKAQLFVAAMELPFDPAERIAAFLAADEGDLPETVVRGFLGIWGNPDFRPPMLALLRSAFSSEQGATMLREFVGSVLLSELRERLPDVDPLRLQAAVAQLVGVAVLRYVVRLEPIASAPEADLVRQLVPAVRRHLQG
jgi:AcrR family transcriptional regulator